MGAYRFLGLYREHCPYSAYCPDFKADVEKMDIPLMGDMTPKVEVPIKCDNFVECDIFVNMKKYEKMIKDVEHEASEKV